MWRHCLPLRSQWTRFLLPDMFVYVYHGTISLLDRLHRNPGQANAVMYRFFPRSSFSASFVASCRSSLSAIWDWGFSRCTDCCLIVPICCRCRKRLIRRPQTTHGQTATPWEIDPAVRGHHERGAVQVRVSNLLSKSFKSHRRLRQGDGLSRLPFNIPMEGVIRWAGLDHDIRGTILYRSFQILGFADDIGIIGKTTAMLCEAYTRLKRGAASIRLRINATKTKEIQTIWEQVYKLTAAIPR